MRAHQVQLHRRGITLELEHLQLADAVLGAEAAAELAHQVVDGALGLLLDRLQLECLRAGALVDVEVQVAVAQVAVGDEHALRNVASPPSRRRLR